MIFSAVLIVIALHSLGWALSQIQNRHLYSFADQGAA